MIPTPSALTVFAVFSNRIKRVGAAIVGATTLVSALPAAAQSWPAGLKAEYEVSFNGFSIGSFEFRAQSEQQSYTLTGNASLSMLLGAISWKGDLRSFGSIVNTAPKPASYTFEARAGSRAVATHLGFDDGTVSSVAHIPELPAKPDMVPLKPAHLQNVLDPLSAMMQVTSGASPCDRRLPIFDGRERFDLVLSRKGEARITEQHLTMQEWSNELDKMVNLGADVQDADRPAFLKYLSKNFGPDKAGKAAPKKSAEETK